MKNCLLFLVPVAFLVSADRPVKDAYILSRNYEVTIDGGCLPGNPVYGQRTDAVGPGQGLSNGDPGERETRAGGDLQTGDNAGENFRNPAGKSVIRGFTVHKDERLWG
jgi:hypothetical protein